MGRTIQCGHCGGEHSSITEVRNCSADNPQPHDSSAPPLPTFEDTDHDTTSAGAQSTSSGPPDRSRIKQRRPSPKSSGRASGRGASTRPTETVKTIPIAGGFDPKQLVGNPTLGRGIVLDPEAEVPEPWRQCEELEVSVHAPSELVDQLYSAWRNREPLIVRWSGPFPSPTDLQDDAPQFHDLTPSYEVPLERLFFAVTANNVVALDAEPHLGGSFAPLSSAIAAGTSRPEPPKSDNRQAARGDVSIGGDWAWLDGGPFDLELAATIDGQLIPRVNWLVGNVQPLKQYAPPTAKLAADQLAAVSHNGGPARILAPAGSGKTRVLTERARYLVTQCGVDPRAVSLVAYNRRAKDEMRERLDDIGRLDVRTLNSMALAIAAGTGPFRAVSQQSPPTTINEIDARRILGRLVPGRRRQRLTDPLESWVDALSACRLGLRRPEEVEAAYGGDITGFPEVLENYRAELKRSNSLDFDEQVVRAIERLCGEPAVRSVARTYAPLLLIDEFQDLTPAHLLLMRLLAGPAGDVFAVGDDDQTIYGYAGASPNWLINFESFFPGAADHRLEVNYRCPPDVVASAVKLLSHNQHRVAKTISPGTDPRIGGVDELNILKSGDPQDNLVSHVQALVDGGASESEIAVLSRVHAALLPAAMHLTDAGFAVVGTAGIGPDMLNRSGVGAAIAWLRLATAPDTAFNGEDIRLALKRPPRSLHPRVADWACEQGSVRDLLRLSERLNTEREADTVASFAADIADMRRAVDDGADTEELLSHLYSEIGLLGAATQLDTSQRTARRAAHADELLALLSVARLHPSPRSFAKWLREGLEVLPRFIPDEPQAGIVLATVHTTKGLEWPHVVVHDCRDDLYPHRLATDIEEERRIFHVAVTRGRESVAVTASGPPSRFIAELAEARPTDRPWPSTPVVSEGRVAGSSAGGKPVAKGSKPGKSDRTEPASAAEAKLREALTEWRRERSKQDKVPAYVVLDNKTLDLIANAAPNDLAALGKLPGIGAVKLERYGADILGLVASAS